MPLRVCVQGEERGRLTYHVDVAGCCVSRAQYVRREVRQLKAEDREAFLDAMEKLYRLPTEEGVALYGDDYKVRASNYRR